MEKAYQLEYEDEDDSDEKDDNKSTAPRSVAHSFRTTTCIDSVFSFSAYPSCLFIPQTFRHPPPLPFWQFAFGWVSWFGYVLFGARIARAALSASAPNALVSVFVIIIIVIIIIISISAFI